MPTEMLADTTKPPSQRPAPARIGVRAALPVILALVLFLATAAQAWATPWGGALTLTPPQGIAGTQIKATAGGAPSGDTIVIGYTTGDCGANVTVIAGATGTVDGTGNISISFTIPDLPPGTYTICATDQATHQHAQSQLTVLPKPSVKVSQPVISGQPVTVSGQNWLPPGQSGSGTVEVTYGGANGCSTSGGTATVDPQGTFSVTFNAPFETSNTSIIITVVEPQGSCGQTNPPPTLQAQTSVPVVVPSISVPQSVDSGKAITITGTNFAPNAGTVEIRYGPQGSNGCATAGGTATVGSDGSFTASFNAPTETKDTTITIAAFQPQGSCGQSKLSASGSTVVKAGATPVPPTPIAPYCVVALLLLLLLLLLLFLLFRRRKKDEPVTIEERDRVLVSPGATIRTSGGAAGPAGAALIDRQIVARDRHGKEVVIAEEVTTVEEEEEEY